MKIAWYVILITLFSGCATQVPTAISKIPADNIPVDEVRMDVDKFSGSEVRWGGVISKVENKAARTWVEIVSRELKKNGQPLSDSKSSGRFIASFAGFIDPVVYEVGASVTVVGRIAGESVRLIGEYAYAFPLVLVSSSYLWPEEDEASCNHCSRQRFGPYVPWSGFRNFYYPYPY